VADAASLPATSIIILGPTAVGKSDVAVELAERLGGEIIGADAFQVYAGLDILSAKPSKELLARVPHHLVGEIPLSEAFDVARYRSLALARAHEIAVRGKVPIICGGAGMYVRALTHGLAELPTADPALRAGMEKAPLPELVEQLKRLDPESGVDENNRRRVIRALEVCLLSGRPYSSFRTEWDASPPVKGLVLTRSRESLLARITARTEAMFAAGVVDEVAKCPVLGSTAGQILGWQEIRAYLAGEWSLLRCKEAIAIATRQYAKRQMTWFRRERGYQWVDLDVEENPSAAIPRLLS
jgi:tRNA dimethylallyltransferase